MNRAFSSFTIKAVSEDRRELEGWASTPSTDRVGDQVMPEGARFDLPLPLLLDHAHDKVVGEVYRAEVTRSGIRFWARVQKIAEPGAAKDLVDYAWSLIKNGLRRVVSIGFRPLAYEPIADGGLRFTSWEWYELSCVGIAAQPEARITATKAARADGVVKLRSGPTRVIKLTPKELRVGKMMAEAIAAAQKKRAMRKRLGIPEQKVRLTPREIERAKAQVRARKEGLRRIRNGGRPRSSVVRLHDPIG